MCFGGGGQSISAWTVSKTQQKQIRLLSSNNSLIYCPFFIKKWKCLSVLYLGVLKDGQIICALGIHNTSTMSWWIEYRVTKFIVWYDKLQLLCGGSMREETSLISCFYHPGFIELEKISGYHNIITKLMTWRRVTNSHSERIFSIPLVLAMVALGARPSDPARLIESKCVGETLWL